MSYSQAILTLFGTAMSLAYDFLTKDLAGFSPTIASAMQTLNNGLQAFSYALLVILTLWNVVKTTTSFVELKRPEVLIKLLIRFILTKYVIGAAWALVNGIFRVCGALIQAIFRISNIPFDGYWINMQAPDFGENVIDKIIQGLIGVGTAIINPTAVIAGLILEIVGFIVAIVLAITLILTVFGRFFKIYMFAALSPIPLSTFGSESTQEVGRNFLKSFTAICAEGLIIGLALIVFTAYSQNPVITFEGTGIFEWVGNLAEEITFMFTQVFHMILLLGIIKGADQIVHRMFGM
ncbi:hypothetical protein ODJ80_10970 [Acutalibacter sp. LFL-21]|uniref:hypothetical protein n=1 Tax=Acutalibacter sp. LFL-21 TaxID=2983399 RepID=UPI0021D68108|nr:hypothetical protein [Acutalibacter sp. LFL-21]MCU7653319.1 hypothetical protein [Acutalibacter sp. LFL-21]